MTGGLLIGKFNSSLLLTAEAQEQEKSVIANRYIFVFAQQNHGMDNILLYPLSNQCKIYSTLHDFLSKIY